MDSITFGFFISLDMRLMEVVTAHLYESLDNDIYKKILEGYKMPEAYNSKFQATKILI